jgi:transposase
MNPTPLALRKRIVAARKDDGQSMGQIAERLQIPKGTVQRVLERYRDSGSLEPKPRNPGRKSAFSEEDLRLLKQDILAHPDATLEELRSRSRVDVSVVSFHNAIRKLGFTRKKSLYTLANNSAQTYP